MEHLRSPAALAQYSFAVAGGALPLANGAALSIRANPAQEAFFAANPPPTLTDPGAISAPHA